MTHFARNGLLLAVFVILAVLIGSAVFKHFSTQEEIGRRGGGPVPVAVATVAMEEFVDRIEAVGTAQSNESVVITARVTETVFKIRFIEGEIAEEGQLLAELIDQEESAELDEARAGLQEAQREYERSKDLVESGTATRSRLDTALSARDRARARVNAIEARLADRLVKAPFSGLIGLRAVSAGTLVSPGDVITTLDDISVIKLDFSIPETYLAEIAAGQEITAVSAAYPDKTFTGEVRVIGTRIDPATRSVVVRADIPNPDALLRPGMLMTVEVLRNRRQSMAIPEAALIPIDERVFVIRIGSDDVAERIQIEIGARRPGRLEVLKGLDVGDRVVVRGTTRVRPGDTVQITSENG